MQPGKMAAKLRQLGERAFHHRYPVVVDERGGVAVEVQSLLDDLCVGLGFCLPPGDQQRLRAAPPHDAKAFADAVFVAEGMDPRLYRQLYQQVLEKIEHRISHWANRPGPGLFT